jgi:acetolactate synthase-1/2/3 large subunit
MTGAQATVAALLSHRVRCVFGVPGAQNNELWDAMKSQVLDYLLVTNESSASIMADASARVTGGVGVFAVVPGPGVTNALTGIGEALYDSVPIVGIVTDIRRDPWAPIGQVHGLHNAAILRPVCKAVFEVRHVAEIPQAIHQAFALARCGEPGPTALVIPFNLYTEVWDFDVPPPPPLPLPIDENAYRRALALLSDRRLRVGIYAGMGCVNATEPLQEVAELLQAPVATSVSGKGVLSEAHPLAVGWGYGSYGTRTAETVFRDVNLVLAVGVKFSEVSTANYALPQKPHLIHVDANPRNLGRNVKSCVNVHADAEVFLSRLAADGEQIRRVPCPPLWSQIRTLRCQERQTNWQVEVKDGVDPMLLLMELQRILCPDDLVFVDVTAAVHWASEVIEVPGPRRYFTPTNNQSMGWAVPAAIGAQRTCPGRRVVSVVGDGSFLMTGLEASTAARSALPVKFFLLEDGAYHYMQMLQEPLYGRTTATQLAPIDYAALAKGLGLAYNCIHANEDLCPGVLRALATPGPVLTLVTIGYKGREIRWLSALKASYLDHMNTGQKLRVARRAIVRSANPLLRDD